MFIVLEGLDGSGKSTQSRFLESILGKENVVLTREPGGTIIGDKIRAFLADPENEELCETADMLLFAASRAQHVQQLILPSIKQGKIVISDRYFYSSMAYQGDNEVNKTINEIATSGLIPDRVYLLDLDPELMFKERLIERDKDERFELKSLEYFKQVRNRYIEIASRNESIFRVIDASLPLEKIYNIIRMDVLSLYYRKQN